MRNSIISSAVAVLAATSFAASAAAPAAPSLTRVMVVADASDESSDLLTVAVAGTPLQRTLGGRVAVLPMRDMHDAMRATRTGEYDVIVGPAHVAASALVYGYELIGSTAGQTKYVLVGAPSVKSLADLKGRRAYFPAQDSMRSYVARGLLQEAGMTPRTLKQVTYGQTSGAGLISMTGGGSEATIALESEWNEWSKSHPKSGVVLATSRDMPSGVTVVVKKDTPDAVRRAVMQWLASPDNLVPNAGRVVSASNAAPYDYVAGLGLFTPTDLKGVTRVTAKQAFELSQKGARLVDVRTEREYNAKHARGSILIPYGEKSLKALDFDSKTDSFGGLSKLDKSQPVVFFCNGAECWKSYKASKVAADSGFTSVYWLRGGMPEWTTENLPTNP
ncbi:MAG: rhodanese-like domain-containing protein [Pseudomonadota bacterium]|nr:PhnD/SsuA/transferrin family substrate-binding protein [Burkholderiaceae bacterium]MDQ3446855.1 rhodanese-like domain-containing protein [Pseudomonadota bacterium]